MFVKILYQLHWNLELCGKFSHKILIFLWENFNISRLVEIVLHVPLWGLNLLGTGWHAFWGGKSLTAQWQKSGITFPAFGTCRYLWMTIRRQQATKKITLFTFIESMHSILEVSVLRGSVYTTPGLLSVCLSVTTKLHLSLWNETARGLGSSHTRNTLHPLSCPHDTRPS